MNTTAPTTSAMTPQPAFAARNLLIDSPTSFAMIEWSASSAAIIPSMRENKQAWTVLRSTTFY